MTTEIIARGGWIENQPYSSEGRWDINYSAILDQLIKSAGKYCKAYASDLFIDWKGIDKELDEGNDIFKQYIFAFRDMGVDGASFYNLHQRIYHEVWKLSIEAHDKEIVMILTLEAN